MPELAVVWHRRGMVEVSIEEMTEREYERWRAAAARTFAAAQVEAGNWAAGDALRRAEERTAQLLPEGRATPGMLFLSGVTADGVRVGGLWIDEGPRSTGSAFLYLVEVYPEYRSSGYGRALLAAGERFLRDRGVSALELNVFGDNKAAVGLYDSSGYRVVTQQMRKELS
jgi:ribosomal protein S18 acetylase RimI-like enzyme